MAHIERNINRNKPHKRTISPRSIQFGLDQRRGGILRTEEAGVQIQSVAGKNLVGGDGQANFDVNFPVTFTELPALSFGAAVDDNQGHGLNAGQTSSPGIDVVVLEWIRYERLPGVFYYKGASLSVVMAGSPGYVWIHWQATAKAFRNPARDLGNTGGTL